MTRIAKMDRISRIFAFVFLAIALATSLIVVNVVENYSKVDIFFDSVGGSDVPIISVNIKSTIILPEAPTKKDYTFTGWSDGSKLFKANESYDIGTQNVTFKASWTENTKYTVTFLGGDGATGTAPTITSQYEGASITLPTNTFSKANYTFAGWSDGSTTKNAGASYVIGTENVTFTASWTENTKYTVTFLGGDGATGTAPTITSQYGGASITLPTNTFSKANYTFAGWSDGSTTKNAGASYVIGMENVTFTASWTEHAKYTVTFLGGEGATGTAPTITSQYGGASITLPTNTFSKANYTFTGWSDGSTTKNAGASYVIGTQNVTLTASWTENTKYTVTFLGGDGATGTAPNITSQYEGASITLPTNPFSKANHTFAGWSDGSTTKNAGASYVIGTENVTFTASWTEHAKYTVTFLGGDGATGSAPTITSQYEGASIILPTNTFSKANYTFAGWFDGSTTQNAGASYVIGTQNVTFTASWTENTKYTVAFLGGEGATGTAPTMASQYEGASITLPTNTFSKTNHTFAGWSDGSTTKNAGASYVIGTQNVTLTASWTENTKYTVTFFGGEGATGTAPTMASQYEGASITLPYNTFTKSNYYFAGWFDGTNEYPAGESFVMSDKAVIFTAVWTYSRINADGTANINSGDYILFGDYPQSEVIDTELTNELTSAAGTTDTWTSYDYYIEGTSSNYMVYKDVTHTDGNRYRGVYFTSYRMMRIDDSVSTDNTRQDENGYDTSTIYWFKYEPIKWKIVKEEQGKATLLADLILDSQAYQNTYSGSNPYYNDDAGTPSGIYANNYEYSTIRAWLNGAFYNTAFSELQKDIIETTTVDNSVASSGYDQTDYYCDDTNDKVFLMSHEEALSQTYGWVANFEDKIRLSSDYAKSQGLFVSTDFWNSNFWLRSPEKAFSHFARYINYDGSIIGTIGNDTSAGVLPVLVIRLNEEYKRINADGTANESGDYILFGDYPQSKVTDTELTNELTSAAGTTDTWMSYDYYIEGTSSNYMVYKDVTHTDGNRYRGVYFTSYRMMRIDDSVSLDNTKQDENGYTTSTIYWFKYEPIKWKIVKEEQGKATLLADLILDSQAYQNTYSGSNPYYNDSVGTPSGIYANNYEYSTIRAWLNGAFYNTAFSELQKEIIETTIVDNSVASSGYEQTEYYCDDTYDKVFLMSYEEALSETDGWIADSEEKIHFGSDYAKSQGLLVSNNMGNSYFWIRSPEKAYSHFARYINYDGSMIGTRANAASAGVLPVLVIIL